MWHEMRGAWRIVNGTLKQETKRLTIYFYRDINKFRLL